MCRSIRTLRGAAPPASTGDARAAALQYVRKISGYRAPSRRAEAAFGAAVDDVAAATERLLAALGEQVEAGPEHLPARRPGGYRSRAAVPGPGTPA